MRPLSRKENIRAWLLLRLKELSEGVQSSLAELTENDRHHLADLEELASDVSADRVIFEHFRSSSDTIAQIEDALRRIDEGAYEECEECGQEVGYERQEALPFATMCVGCKRLAEKSVSHLDSGYA